MNRKSRGNGTGTAFMRGNTWMGQVVIGWRDNHVPIKKSKQGFQSKEEALAWCAKMLPPKQIEYKTISVEEFFKQKESRKASGDVVGVYVLFNKKNKQYYVGQTKRLYERVYQHFTGRGNGDVYADYKYGATFTITLIPLTTSGYQDLDKLEKDMIAKYDSYNSGYNRNSGNGE